jgi:hypothetical protein
LFKKVEQSRAQTVLPGATQGASLPPLDRYGRFALSPAGKLITHVASINYACDEGGLIALHWYFEGCQGLEIKCLAKSLKLGLGSS